jgi:hypothetical protein
MEQKSGEFLKLAEAAAKPRCIRGWMWQFIHLALPGPAHLLLV